MLCSPEAAMDAWDALHAPERPEPRPEDVLAAYLDGWGRACAQQGPEAGAVIKLRPEVAYRRAA
ncbi:MAG: hypothetical protein AAF845_05630 [Bacteroidota bacterium]